MNVEVLRQELRGEVLAPGDATFVEHSRVFNARAQHAPRCVARCLDTADAAAAVRSSDSPQTRYPDDDVAALRARPDVERDASVRRAWGLES